MDDDDFAMMALGATSALASPSIDSSASISTHITPLHSEIDPSSLPIDQTEPVTPLSLFKINPSLITIPTDDDEEVHKLGAGGFGQVIVGRYTGAEVALKFSHVDTQESAKPSQEAIMHFQLRHPHVLTPFGFSYLAPFPSEPPTFCLVMERMECSLTDMVQDQKITSEGQMVNACLQILQGIKFLHTANPPVRGPVVHSDIKPDNILVSMGQRLKVCDFGTSVIINDEFTSPHAVTPNYAAPEMLEGKLCCLSDCFSIGGVVYFIATQHQPFEDCSHLYHVMDRFSRNDLPIIPPETPEWIKTLIAGLWQLNVADRWDTQRAIDYLTNEVSKTVQSLPFGVEVKEQTGDVTASSQDLEHVMANMRAGAAADVVTLTAAGAAALVERIKTGDEDALATATELCKDSGKRALLLDTGLAKVLYSEHVLPKSGCLELLSTLDHPTVLARGTAFPLLLRLACHPTDGSAVLLLKQLARVTRFNQGDLKEFTDNTFRLVLRHCLGAAQHGRPEEVKLSIQLLAGTRLAGQMKVVKDQHTAMTALEAAVNQATVGGLNDLGWAVSRLLQRLVLPACLDLLFLAPSAPTPGVASPSRVVRDQVNFRRMLAWVNRLAHGASPCAQSTDRATRLLGLECLTSLSNIVIALSASNQVTRPEVLLDTAVRVVQAVGPRMVKESHILAENIVKIMYNLTLRRVVPHNQQINDMLVTIARQDPVLKERVKQIAKAAKQCRSYQI
eukprot:gnl/Dysnectes_brevis/3039_a3764_1336.p1 GENE.gnl/Dysnectes_brevis/3039_a3764_1336~~gnl/Dysnectes_brevis/3039_a3764_1336.p1  ORF type:complete len:732 (+),score=226.74 gnl/Dysnectes_brevis/3039_a3764_1336:36-2231(+)